MIVETIFKRDRGLETAATRRAVKQPSRHCERSEAIHRAVMPRLETTSLRARDAGLLRRRGKREAFPGAPRNDGRFRAIVSEGSLKRPDRKIDEQPHLGILKFTVRHQAAHLGADRRRIG